MEQRSRYLHYLPPVLWATDESNLNGERAPFLGRMLRIFEKILTGIDDTVVLQSGARPYAALEETIDQLHRLFNPYSTPDAFLAYLAAWVALPLRQDLSNYQQRKLLNDIVTIYRQRGTKAGLSKYLEIFQVTTARPRIVLDAGEALFRARRQESGAVTLHAVAYSTPFRNASAEVALLHPTAIVVDQEGRYVIADVGSTLEQPERPPSIWRLSNIGAFEYGSTELTPHPLYRRQAGQKVTIDHPVALVVEPSGAYVVLDYGQESEGPALYRLAPPTFAPQAILDTATTTTVKPLRPVDMLRHPNGDFVVLTSSGQRLGLNEESRVGLVLLREQGTRFEPHWLNDLPAGDLANVVEPTALVMDDQGRYLVADTRDAQSTQPANLIRIDPNNGWTRTALLPETNNPLIYPTGLAFERPDRLLVCDVGLRSGFAEDDPGNRLLAEQPALYAIDLASTPPTITRINHNQPMIYPSKLVIDHQGDILITDQGEFYVGIGDQRREWRAHTHELGVVVHFSQARPLPGELEERARARNRLRFIISDIVREQKPAHIVDWFKSS